jgi:hypothetical protein
MTGEDESCLEYGGTVGAVLASPVLLPCTSGVVAPVDCV